MDDMTRLGRSLGLATVADLARSGISRASVDARLRRGLWWRPLPRVVCLSAGRHLTREQRRVATLLWLPPCAVLSHFDAAALWGLAVAEPEDVHVTVDRRHNPRPQPGYAVHRVDTLPDLDRAVRAGLRVTSFERTVVDTHDLIARRADRRAFVTQVFQQRRTTLGRLLGVVGRLPKLHHRTELVETASLAAGGLHSGREIDAYDWLVAAGFPPPVPQFPTVVAGRLRYIDLADPVLRIAYEVDGLAHGELAQRDADNDRDLELAADWWETVRVTTFRIRRDPAALRDKIARLRAQRQRMADAGLLLPATRADAA
ncbi:MAG TPA: hypothetical protein VF519_05390 [Mycobacteriales bacterium]|jgi:hypothetical protein